MKNLAGTREVPLDGTKTVVFWFDFSKKFFEELFTFGFLEKDFFLKIGPYSHQSFLSKHYTLKMEKAKIQHFFLKLLQYFCM